MLSRFRNPAREAMEIGRPVFPVRQDNWGTMQELQAPDVVGTNIVESRDLIDVALPDNQAGPFSVTLAGPLDGMLVPTTWPLTWGLQAELTFGNGGASTVALADWIRGQTFSIHCGRLRVRALWNSIVTNAAARTMSVGAFAAAGSPHGHRPAQLTTFIANLATPLGAATVEVPILARRLFLLGTPVNVPFNVDFLSPNGGVIANYVVAAYPSAALPIPGGSRWVTVTNGGLVLANPRLVWELDL